MKYETNKLNRTWIQKVGIAAFTLAVLFVPTLTYARKFTPEGKHLVVTIKDGPVGFLPGQSLKYNLYNPAPAGTPVSNGHVKIFDHSSQLIAQTNEVAIPAGCFHSFDIPRQSINLPGDPNTGRLQVRVEIEISVWVESTQSGETPTVEFPTSYELVERQTGKTILIGHLLPAVIKVR